MIKLEQEALTNHNMAAQLNDTEKRLKDEQATSRAKVERLHQQLEAL